MRQRILAVPTLFLAALTLMGGSVIGAEVPEVEPNDSAAEADAHTIFSGDAIIAGAIDPAADVDWFRLDLAAESVVRFESFDSSGGDCVGLGTTLRLFTPGPAQIHVDTNSGIANCSALVVHLVAGTYYVSLVSTPAVVVSSYRLQIKVQTDLGPEIEPNPDVTTAHPLTGSDVFVTGLILNNPVIDRDWYRVTIGPRGGSIRAEVIDGPTHACASNSDTVLKLYGVTGLIVLTTDDDSGRGTCSKIDGTGSVPGDATWAQSHNLPAGNYYLQVTEFRKDGTTDYRLAVTIVPIDHIFKNGFEG